MHQADLFVVVAYGILLPSAVLDLPRLGCINGHASLLPRWRGAAPIQRAIAAGDRHTGISAMLMDQGLDTGMILAQKKCTINNNDTAGSLHDKLANLNANLLDDVIMNFNRRLKAAEPQDHNRANYAAKITTQDAKIDWTLSAKNLHCHIRAYAPFPGAWCYGPKGRIRILAAHPLSTSHTNPPGTVIGIHKGELKIATGKGVLVIDQLQPAGKKPMVASDFLNGYRLEIDQLLALKSP